MPSIIIGRGQYGQQQQVLESKSISRQHARLSKIGPNLWKITDLGSRYGTFVDGVPIVEAEVGLDTPILLADFATSVRSLLGLENGGNRKQSTSGDINGTGRRTSGNKAVTPVSVAHLCNVYDDYHNAIKRIAKKRQKAQLTRMIPLQLLMPLAVGLSGIYIKQSEFGSILKGVITIGVMGLTGIMALRVIHMVDGQTDEQFELTKQFQIDYVCPKCKSFLGPTTPYEALLNRGQCQVCKTPFLESLTR